MDVSEVTLVVEADADVGDDPGEAPTTPVDAMTATV